MSDTQEIRMEWCSDEKSSHELARFFAENITTSYISHSELQGPRAIDANHWRPNIEEVFEEEIRERIIRTEGKISKSVATLPIFAVRAGTTLVAFGMASFFPDAPVSYAMLEDIVVSKDARGQGIGTEVVDWIVEEARKVGCKRVFLESGVENHHAHDFFEAKGFSPCSVVMMRNV